MEVATRERAPVDILYVEDNPADVRLAQEVFGASKTAVRLHVARDGIEALVFLRREGAQSGAPRPKLILLDINMPRMNGHEVLAKIDNDKSLKSIPIIILTSAELDDDIKASFRPPARFYMRKPISWDTFETLVANINEFWLDADILPEGPR